MPESPARDTTLDMWNNLIFDWGVGYGTLIRNGARANIVNNFYSSNGGDKDDGLIACTGPSPLNRSTPESVPAATQNTVPVSGCAGTSAQTNRHGTSMQLAAKPDFPFPRLS